jgi:hypothetical protein
MVPRKLVVSSIIAVAAIAAWGTSATLFHFADERRMWLRYAAAGTVGYIVLVATLTILFGRLWRPGADRPRSRVGGSWDVPDVSDALSLFEDPVGCLVVLLGIAAVVLGFFLFNAVGGVVELGIEAAVVGTTVRRLGKYHSADWGLGLRKTVVPAAILVAAIAFLAAIIQLQYPHVRTMHEFLSQWF